jgi:hypothetical protein
MDTSYHTYRGRKTHQVSLAYHRVYNAEDSMDIWTIWRSTNLSHREDMVLQVRGQLEYER